MLKKWLEKVPVTAWIILANVLIYTFAAFLSGNFLVVNIEVLFLFGISWFAIAQGWYWTFITTMFIHHDLIHLISNMLFLGVFGVIYEKEAGRLLVIIIYFLAGFSAGILSLFAFPSMVLIGASAAIFGIAGATILRQIKSIIFTALFVILLFALSPALSFLVHSVGVIVGVIIDRLMIKTEPLEKRIQITDEHPK